MNSIEWTQSRPTKPILLTGATGFLGSHLLKRLIDDGFEVVALKRSTSDLWRIHSFMDAIKTYDLDRSDLAAIFRRHPFELVIHCATNYGRRELDPLAVVDANLTLPLKLLKLSVDHGVSNFINTDTILDKRIGSYSLSKKQFLEWMQNWSTQLSSINVALEHFYGPDDDPSKFTSFIISEVLLNKPKIDLTPGEQKRDFIHVADVVEAFMTIIQHSKDFSPGVTKFEVGSGNKIRIKDFVSLIQRLAKNTSTELVFGALPYRPGEVMATNIDISKLQKLGWSPKISLEQGLLETIAHQKARK